MQCWRKVFFRISSMIGLPNVQIATGTIQLQSRNISSAASEDFYTREPIRVLKTTLKCPRDHTHEQLGMWYTLDPAMATRLFHIDGLTRRLKELNGILRETSFMIREPAVSIIDYVNKSNLSDPPNKFVLYGRNGTGKTISLAHIIHHFVEEQWMVIHAAVPARWATLYKEIVPSPIREGFYDHPLDASNWLQQFRAQNETLLKSADLRANETYQWTQRESTEKGSPLLSLVDFGIGRARYASDCVFHLNNELKKCAREGKIKLAVVIDGLNALFSADSKFRSEDRSLVPVEKFTLFQAFLQMLQTDWKNGVIVGSVDIIMSTKERRKSHLPRYLLGKKGWEMLDPFVPIPVNAYTNKEFESAVSYYLDLNWIQHENACTREAKDELAFLSGKNPGELIKLIAYL